MAIVSYDYYFSSYMGEPVADADWLSISKRAERLIKQITHGRVAEDTFAALPPALQTAAKEAICAEIEYISLMGKDVTITGDTASGWTVGLVAEGADGTPRYSEMKHGTGFNLDSFKLRAHRNANDFLSSNVERFCDFFQRFIFL